MEFDKEVKKLEEIKNTFKDLTDQILGNKKAGAVGIEPTSTVLETAVLPLNYAPIYPVFQPPNAIITYRRFPCQD